MGKRKKPTPEAHWSKRLWYFIWHDDSLLSWVVNIILAFILIKFVVYPLLGALFGTALPLVAVISESMEHNTAYDAWWGETASCQGQQVCPYAPGYWYEQQGITKEQFAQFPLHKGFNRGDVIVLFSAKQIEQGDVIVFQSQKPYPIIHRVIDIRTDEQGTFYITKGDNNPGPIVATDLNELNVREEQLMGKAVVKIPYIGYLRLLFSDLLSLLGGA